MGPYSELTIGYPEDFPQKSIEMGGPKGPVVQVERVQVVPARISMDVFPYGNPGNPDPVRMQVRGNVKHLFLEHGGYHQVANWGQINVWWNNFGGPLLTILESTGDFMEFDEWEIPDGVLLFTHSGPGITTIPVILNGNWW